MDKSRDASIGWKIPGLKQRQTHGLSQSYMHISKKKEWCSWDRGWDLAPGTMVCRLDPWRRPCPLLPLLLYQQSSIVNKEATPFSSVSPIPSCIAPKGRSLPWFSSSSFLENIQLSGFLRLFLQHLLTDIWMNGKFSSRFHPLDPGSYRPLGRLCEEGLPLSSLQEVTSAGIPTNTHHCSPAGIHSPPSLKLGRRDWYPVFSTSTLWTQAVNLLFSVSDLKGPCLELHRGKPCR